MGSLKRVVPWRRAKKLVQLLYCAGAAGWQAGWAAAGLCFWPSRPGFVHTAQCHGEKGEAWHVPFLGEDGSLHPHQASQRNTGGSGTEPAEGCPETTSSPRPRLPSTTVLKPPLASRVQFRAVGARWQVLPKAWADRPSKALTHRSSLGLCVSRGHAHCFRLVHFHSQYSPEHWHQSAVVSIWLKVNEGIRKDYVCVDTHACSQSFLHMGVQHMLTVGGHSSLTQWQVALWFHGSGVGRGPWHFERARSGNPRTGQKTQFPAIWNHESETSNRLYSPKRGGEGPELMGTEVSSDRPEGDPAVGTGAGNQQPG